MFLRLWNMAKLQGRLNIAWVMRQSVDLPQHVIRDARMLTGRDSPADALEAVVQAHRAAIADLRKLRRRIADLDVEYAELSAIRARFERLAREILDQD